MPRGQCHRHGQERPCSCSMGNVYRFVEPVVLHLLRQNGRAHGYELAKALQGHALTDSLVERAALYRTLAMLEQNGYVTSEWEVTGSGPARHLYHLTPIGQRHLDEWVIVLDGLAASMARFVSDARASSAAGGQT